MASPAYADTLLRLAHATWAPSDCRYLLSISLRLSNMADDQPELLTLLNLSRDGIRALPGLIEQDVAANPTKFAELHVITKSPANHSSLDVGGFPLQGLLSLAPGYSLFATQLPKSAALYHQFEKMMAAIFVHIIKANLAQSPETYNQSTIEIFRREKNSSYPFDDQFLPPLTRNLKNLSLAARKVVSDLAAAQPDSLSESEQKTWSEFAKEHGLFISAPSRPKRPRGTKAKDPAQKAKRNAQIKTERYRSDGLATYLSSGWELKELTEMEGWAEDQHLDKFSYRVTKHYREIAQHEDISPFELMDEDWDVCDSLNEFITLEAAKQAGKYQAQQFSNAAQLLRWSTANLTPASIDALIRTLEATAQSTTDNGLVATLLLVSIALGQPLESIFPDGFILDNASTFSEPDNKKILAVFLPQMRAIAIRVNQPKISTVATWEMIQERQNFVLVPDYLHVSDHLMRFSDVISSGNSRNSRSQSSIYNAAKSLIKQLNIDGANPSKVWQLLPRSMQNESGMFTGMALLTGWQSANSAVDLHYHCVPAGLVCARYMAAMGDILGSKTQEFRQQEQALAKQLGYVGSPNGIKNEAITTLIAQFKAAFEKYRHNVIETHNLKCLYTLMLCTAGFGLRHAVNPRFEVTRHGSICWLSYIEKGQSRQLQPPKLVDEQLLSFETHLQSMSVRPYVNALISSGNQFPLLDARSSTRSVDFHPGKIKEHLAPYNIDFKLPLNSLRRWMFSQQFIDGARGIGTDLYGGHGVQGRLPLVARSSTTFAAYEEIAQSMDRILRNAGWMVF